MICTIKNRLPTRHASNHTHFSDYRSVIIFLLSVILNLKKNQLHVSCFCNIIRFFRPDIYMNEYNTPFYERTKALLGADGISRLARARVAVFGIGGVGSYSFEALVRAGVGNLIIIDADVVEESNCNRQLIALQSTIGIPKVDVAIRRAHDINPNCVIENHKLFINAENINPLFKMEFTHAIDAIDSNESKIALIRALLQRKIAFVACMGGAQRLDPTKVRISDIANTFGCPHAKSIRRRLRAIGIEKGVRCVYSTETPAVRSHNTLGSISYIPGIIGLTAAGIIINDILHNESSLTTNHTKGQ